MPSMTTTNQFSFPGTAAGGKGLWNSPVVAAGEMCKFQYLTTPPSHISSTTHITVAHHGVLRKMSGLVCVSLSFQQQSRTGRTRYINIMESAESIALSPPPLPTSPTTSILSNTISFFAPAFSVIAEEMLIFGILWMLRDGQLPSIAAVTNFLAYPAHPLQIYMISGAGRLRESPCMVRYLQAPSFFESRSSPSFFESRSSPSPWMVRYLEAPSFFESRSSPSPWIVRY